MIENLVIILSLVLFISVALNVFVIWYSIRMTGTLVYFSENMNDLLDILQNYASHVKSVYSLESFYGDQVLQNLLRHSEDIVEQIETFEEVLYLTEEGGDMNEQEEQVEQDDTDSRAEPEAQEAKNPTRIWSGL